MRRYEVHSLEQQCKRAWAQLQERPNPLAKYTCASRCHPVDASRHDELTLVERTVLSSLRDQNIVLFYSLCLRHLNERASLLLSLSLLSELN